MDLSLNVRAFISQRLIPSLDGKRAVAVEVMLGTPLILDLILKGDIHGIREIMEKSTNLGMQTFDQAIYDLYKQGRISLEEALRNADSQNNLRLKISLSEGTPPVDPSLKIEMDADDGGNALGRKATGFSMELSPK
jgi:twitching motility protein PilU